MRVRISYYAVCHLKPELGRELARAAEEIPPELFRCELDTGSGAISVVLGGDYGTRLHEIVRGDPQWEGKYRVREITDAG